MTRRERRPWHGLKERGTTWGLRLTVGVFRVCGRGPTAVVVHLVVAYFWLTDPPRRRASLEYLKRVAATPGGLATLGGTPGWLTTYRHFQAFGTSILDRFALVSAKTAFPAPTVHGQEHLDQLAEQGRGAILLGSHLGNLEACRLLAKEHPVPIHAVMHAPETDRFRLVMRRTGRDSHQRVIHTEKGAIQAAFDIRAAVERGELVAILGDRVAAGQRQPTSLVSFFGGDVLLPHGPLVLAGLIGCPVLLAFGLRQPGGSYQLQFEPFAEHVELERATRQQVLSRLLQAYAARLEEQCTRVPLQWFNFHNVWHEDRRAVE